MNSQHDPKTRFKNWMSMFTPTMHPAHWVNQATKYPHGVFQSNGNLILEWKLIFKFFLNGLCLSLIHWSGVRTKQGKTSKMNPRPCRRCSIWQTCTAQPLKAAMKWWWKAQNIKTCWTIRLFRWIYHIQLVLNELLSMKEKEMNRRKLQLRYFWAIFQLRLRHSMLLRFSAKFNPIQGSNTPFF